MAKRIRRLWPKREFRELRVDQSKVYRLPDGACLLVRENTVITVLQNR